jgi:alcohol dehydrogenase (cytochrome c)
MNRTWLCVALIALGAAAGFTQTMDELIQNGKTGDRKITDNVLAHSMSYSRQSYSPLKQINKANVKRLAPVWSTSLMNDQGELAAPVIYDGVMYVINGKWTFAIDVETGKQIWRTAVEPEPGVTRSAFNRGAAALYNGKLFRVTIDNHVLALDMKTGAQIWNQKFADLHDGFGASPMDSRKIRWAS